MADLFFEALRIAFNAHDGQTDKSGAPYILHPIRVALMGESADERVVGLLHDVVEDCDDWPLGRLADRMPDHIVDAVDALTRQSGEEYADFIDRLASNPLAARVKLNDIADNMDPVRLALLPVDMGAKLRRKYSRAIRALTDAGRSAVSRGKDGSPVESGNIGENDPK